MRLAFYYDVVRVIFLNKRVHTKVLTVIILLYILIYRYIFYYFKNIFIYIIMTCTRSIMQDMSQS